jgi:hypothetical protein
MGYDDFSWQRLPVKIFQGKGALFMGKPAWRVLFQVR